MHEHSDHYISKCLEVGILTEDNIRKYPLRPANLATVLKAYAISMKLPYTIDNHNFDILDDYKLYLTDGGFEWLLDFFSQHSLEFLRHTFSFVFSMATAADISNPDYQGYKNFRGLRGIKPKAGTKQQAILVRTVGRTKRETHYETLLEARQAVIDLTRFYPADEFKLYRIRVNRKNGKETYYRSEVPLFIDSSKRGAVVNLPNVKKVRE